MKSSRFHSDDFVHSGGLRAVAHSALSLWSDQSVPAIEGDILVGPLASRQWLYSFVKMQRAKRHQGCLEEHVHDRVATVPVMYQYLAQA